MRRLILANVPPGRCVLYEGRWGVTCGKNSVRRVVDFWDGGREYVPVWKVVEVLA